MLQTGWCLGRPEEDANRVRTRNIYDGYGYLASVKDVGDGTVYWSADAVDAFGRVKQETLGNGAITSRTYDRATGYLKAIQTGRSGSRTSVQDMEFSYDPAANLRTRKDRRGVNGTSGVREYFGYDALSRLTGTTRYTQADGSTVDPNGGSEAYAYDDFGNLVSKGSEYTTYCYNAEGSTGQPCASVTGAGPHAVSRVIAGGVARNLTYNANGSVIGATHSKYDTITWWASNLPKRISKGASYVEFTYGPDRARYKQYLYRGASDTETILYVGGLYERRTKVDGATTTVEHTHYVRAGESVIALFKRSKANGSALPDSTRYLHRDHLGSVVALTDAALAVERVSFDPWGKRRDAATWDPSAPGTYAAGSAYTNRGYTGHEGVEEFGFIHMNGRIYDPEIGRFLSADPMMQFPESTQGFNRYTYVGNSPLSYTDPSGFFSFKDLVTIVIVVVISFYTGFTAAGWMQGLLGGGAIGTGAAAFGGFVGGFTGGFLSSGGDFKTALLAGIGGALTAGIGSKFGGGNLLAGGDASIKALQKAFLHGAVQGSMQAAMGGRFGDGLLGGAFGSIMEPFSEFIAAVGDSEVLATLATAVIGGTAATLGGGKFANGAASAAFVHMFNHSLHDEAGVVKISRDRDSAPAELFERELAALQASGAIPKRGSIAWLLGGRFKYVDGYAVQYQDRGKRVGVFSTLDEALASAQMTGGEVIGGVTRPLFGSTIYRNVSHFSEIPRLGLGLHSPADVMRWTILHERGHQVNCCSEFDADSFAEKHFPR